MMKNPPGSYINHMLESDGVQCPALCARVAFGTSANNRKQRQLEYNKNCSKNIVNLFKLIASCYLRCQLFIIRFFKSPAKMFFQHI